MSDEVEPRREGGVAGAGFGTGYVGLISLLPARLHWLRDILVFAAPVITIASAVAWIIISSWAIKKIQLWYLKGAIREANAIRKEYEDDPKSKPAERKRARDAVSDLRKIKLDVIAGTVTDIRARLKQIPR